MADDLVIFSFTSAITSGSSGSYASSGSPVPSGSMVFSSVSVTLKGSELAVSMEKAGYSSPTDSSSQSASKVRGTRHAKKMTIKLYLNLKFCAYFYLFQSYFE